MTQIANLLLLAPEIQEALLLSSASWTGKSIPTERALRTLSLECAWLEQARRYRMLA
jgi:hypothetical protein